MQLEKKAASLWGPLAAAHVRAPVFFNFLYSGAGTTVFRPHIGAAAMRLWPHFYLRHGASSDPLVAMASATDPVAQAKARAEGSGTEAYGLEGHDQLPPTHVQIAASVMELAAILNEQAAKECDANAPPPKPVTWLDVWRNASAEFAHALAVQREEDASETRSRRGTEHREAGGDEYGGEDDLDSASEGGGSFKGKLKIQMRGGTVRPRKHMYPALKGRLSLNKAGGQVLTSQHCFQLATFRTPTWCQHCSQMLWGLRKQGHRCSDCGIAVHEKCIRWTPADCQGNFAAGGGGEGGRNTVGESLQVPKTECCTGSQHPGQAGNRTAGAR